MRACYSPGIGLIRQPAEQASDLAMAARYPAFARRTADAIVEVAPSPDNPRSEPAYNIVQLLVSETSSEDDGWH